MARFNVVRVHGRQLIVCGNVLGPYIFESADDATRYAQSQSYLTGVKHQPRPIKSDVDWRKREKERFKSGHYTKLPWHREAWVKKAKEASDHFAHVSRQDQTLIAFTRDETSAERDVKAVMRPSKYLMQYYGFLGEDEIRTQVAKYKKLYDKDNLLSFAYDAKEIVRVYRKGPHSCMKSGFRSKVHPVSVYAGPDLAVAYTERNGRITARCVVWPKKKIYTRIYGDDYLLMNLLEDEGYREGTLEGARLTKIKEGNRYVCPYVDYIQKVKIGRKYLTVSCSGKHYAGNQDGFCGRGFSCASCNNWVDVGKAEVMGVRPWRHVNGQHWCIPCTETALKFKTIAECTLSNQYFNITDMVLMHGINRYWFRAYAGDRYRAFRCSSCREYWPNAYLDRGTPNVIGHQYNENPRCQSCASKQQALTVATSPQ